MAILFGGWMPVVAVASDQDEPVIAKRQFGMVAGPARLKPRVYGGYARGCVSGAEKLPDESALWQTMRTWRNRHWGHPVLINHIKRFAQDLRTNGEWPGLLVGDLAQPRGGPMLSGHASHQLGLDADFWLNPMPPGGLTFEQREKMSATSMLVGAKKFQINDAVWTEDHYKLLKRAVSYRNVDRVFVHPAIKERLCAMAGSQNGWLRKVRPLWGHHYHFHVRLKCPAGSPGCRSQKPIAQGSGCEPGVFKYWRRLMSPKPKPKPRVVKPRQPKRAIKRRKKFVDRAVLTDLPRACTTVLAYGEPPVLRGLIAVDQVGGMPARNPAR
ncbi:MAG: penicillin-insensitive murein endopeptidase [Pseudomonadota bacterium]